MEEKTISTVDRMYDDFVNELLPTIQEGLVITKDYFVDLFGRYVTFLIITDVIALLAAALTMYLMIRTSKSFIKKWKVVTAENEEKSYYTRDTDSQTVYSMVIGVCFVGSIFASIAIYDQLIDISKAVFIPEVRVYEEVTDYMKPPVTSQE